MRNLNGNHFTVQLVVDFEFSFEEADQFLAAKSEQRPKLLDDLLQFRHAVPEESSYNAEEFRKAIGKALADRREQQLKQLPETTQ